MNEREEMEAENNKENAKVNSVRGEIQRMAAGLRSMVITGVTPTGEMVTLCFYNGYADLRAIQIESVDRIRDIINANAKRVPTESV
jgi:hypothetical protein